MSTTDRVERDITAWFGETAAPATPDYTDDILRQTARSRQRPRWTFSERWLPMSVITFGRVNLRPVPWRTVGLLAVLGLLLAVAAAVYVGSQPQRLPPPFGAAANGLVAYSKDGDIFTVDPITGARSAIVTGSTVDAGPAYSLDGSRLAFARTTDTGQVIVVADADGRNQVEIPMTPLAEVSQAAWSPDGRWIAVAGGDADAAASLWIVDTVAQTARKTEGLVLDDEALLWRPPDGRQLAVLAQVPNAVRFALVTPGVDSVEYLAPVGYLGGQFRAGGWTPDGSRFVYASDPPWGQVHVLEVDGGRDVQIQPSMEGQATIYPRLSNDGRRVLFMEQGPAGTWLSVAPSDGSKAAIRVSDIYGDGIGTHYSWSPDDTKIEFEPNVGPKVLLDPAGGPPTTPAWIAEGAESWQRLAR